VDGKDEVGRGRLCGVLGRADRLYHGRHRRPRTALSERREDIRLSRRDLPNQFTFTVFCDWIHHELEAELVRRWEIEINGVGVPDVHAPGRGLALARGLRLLIRQQQHSVRVT